MSFLSRTEHLEGTVVVLTLDRPPVNALSLAMWQELAEALDAVSNDGSRCAVLASSTPGVFCAGGDVKEFAVLDAGSRLERHATVNRAIGSLAELPIPIVCALDGAAVGAGVALAAACDIRIASSRSTFALPEIARGTVGGGGSFLRQLGMPEGAVRRLLLTGDSISAEWAFRLGLVDELCGENADALDAALSLAYRVAERPLSVIRLMKSAILETHRLHSDWLGAYAVTHPMSAQLTADGYGRSEILRFLADGSDQAPADLPHDRT